MKLLLVAVLRASRSGPLSLTITRWSRPQPVRKMLALNSALVQHKLRLILIVRHVTSAGPVTRRNKPSGKIIKYIDQKYSDLFKRARVQLVQTLHDVGLVQPGAPVLGDGVEEVVAEQLQHVAVARFRPRDVEVEPAAGKREFEEKN